MVSSRPQSITKENHATSIVLGFRCDFSNSFGFDLLAGNGVSEGGLWFNIFAELVGTIIGITYVQYMIDAINKTSGRRWTKQSSNDY